MTRQTLDLAAAEKARIAMSNLDRFIAQWEPRSMLKLIASHQDDPSQYLIEAVSTTLIYLNRDTIRGQLTKFYSENPD